MNKGRKITESENLLPDSSNPNRGTERGRSLVTHSLRHYGAGRSILADRNGVVIAGNTTLETAADIGPPGRVIETDGTIGRTAACNHWTVSPYSRRYKIIRE